MSERKLMNPRIGFVKIDAIKLKEAIREYVRNKEITYTRLLKSIDVDPTHISMAIKRGGNINKIVYEKICFAINANPSKFYLVNYISDTNNLPKLNLPPTDLGNAKRLVLDFDVNSDDIISQIEDVKKDVDYIKTRFEGYSENIEHLLIKNNQLLEELLKKWE